MRIIDLTHTIAENMPVYPGTEPPRLTAVNTIDKHGFRETLLTMLSHTGTHMDAPAHLVSGRPTLDALPVEQFIGTGLVIDCTDLGEGQRITMERIQPVKEKADRADYLLFHTGWDKRWGTGSYFEAYPCITEEVADYLIIGGKKGVGLDVISIDPIGDPRLTIHKKLFSEAEMVIVENLARLGDIGKELFTFCALPLKYGDADGAPVRAVAVLNE